MGQSKKSVMSVLTQKTLKSEGLMGQLILQKDWSKHPLGPMIHWPQSLKTALSICLSSKFPMFVWWGRDLIVFYNDAYIPLAGPLKHPRYLGCSAHEQWADIWDVVGPLAEGVLANENATWSEDLPLFMTRTGVVEETYFTFSYSPARDEKGAVGGVFCACQETTTRVIGERRLKMLRELGAEGVKSVPEVGASVAKALNSNPNDVPFSLIYLTSTDGKSATLVGVSGIKADSLAAPKTLDLTLPTPASWPITRVNKSKQSERVDGLRSLFPTDLPQTPYEEMPDSAYVLPIELAGQETLAGFIILGISPRLAFNDNYQGFFDLVCKHITNRISSVRAFEEERARAEALAEIDHAKTAFFSNISHEFRTPLTLILGPLEDVLRSVDQQISGDVVKMVHRNALRLMKLVNSLLDFSRIEAGRMKAQFVDSDLASITTDLASSFRSAVESAGLVFEVKCKKLAKPVYVDHEMLEKIILNLLSNALKFTFKGKISISLRDGGDFAQLEVRDTGTGIPQNEIPNLFKRFHRIEGARSRSHEGSGIGLALVHDLLELHGAHIQVSSQVNEGTTFTLSIPYGSTHLPADQIKHRSTTKRVKTNLITEEALQWSHKTSVKIPEETKNSTSKLRVLVVDDNADLRDYVAGILGPWHDVQTAVDGIAALEAIKARKPDLVLSDVMMPRLDGFGLLKALRENKATMDLPVILLSARAGEDSGVEGLAAGANDYLIKPFSAIELLARVRSQAEFSRKRQEWANKLKERATEMVAMNKELVKLNEQLKTTAQLKTQFFANVSHELRTPLTLILGPLERHLSNPNNTGKLRGDLNVIKRNTIQLLKYVNDLLNIAKLESQKMTLCYRRQDLAKLVRFVAANFETVAQERKCSYEVKTPNVFVAEFDPEKIESVLINLLSNAFKFTGLNGIVRCGLLVKDQQNVNIQISDSGPGVPKEQRKFIFERFMQAESGSGGTGLGLSIAHEFIKLHHGSITVGDSEQGGALFTASIQVFAPKGVGVLSEEMDERSMNPITWSDLDSSSSVEVNSAELDVIEASGVDNLRPRILIVENNSDMRRFLKESLEKEFRIILASDGADGIKKALKFHPDLDLILTDMMMPVKTGQQLIREIRDNHPELSHTPIIIFTAKADDDLRTNLLEAGAQEYIIKPFLFADVQARVRNLITTKKAHDSLEAQVKELQISRLEFEHVVSAKILDLVESLRIVSRYCQLLAQRYSKNLDEEGQDFVERAKNSSHHLLELVHGIVESLKSHERA